MEGELVIVAIISTVGMMITVQLWQMNWFKRENFKMRKKNVMDENKLKMRKLEKEMGLSPGKSGSTSPGLDIPSLLGLVKNLDPDQLGGLIEALQGGGYEAAAPEGLEGILLQVAQNNPELIQGFLKGLSGDKETETTEETTQPFPSQTS